LDPWDWYIYLLTYHKNQPDGTIHGSYGYIIKVELDNSKYFQTNKEFQSASSSSTAKPQGIFSTDLGLG